MLYSAIMAAVGLLQTFLVVRQMESTSTPSSIARVSYWTISLQGGMDSYSFVTHCAHSSLPIGHATFANLSSLVTLGTVVDHRAAYALLLPAFFSALSGLLFGLRYAASIRVATAPSAPSPPPPPPTPAQAAARAAQARSEQSQTPAEEEPTTPAPAPVPETWWRAFWREDSPACEPSIDNSRNRY